LSKGELVVLRQAQDDETVLVTLSLSKGELVVL